MIQKKAEALAKNFYSVFTQAANFIP